MSSEPSSTKQAGRPCTPGLLAGARIYSQGRPTEGWQSKDVSCPVLVPFSPRGPRCGTRPLPLVSARNKSQTSQQLRRRRKSSTWCLRVEQTVWGKEVSYTSSKKNFR